MTSISGGARWWPPILVLAVLVASVALVIAWVNVLGAPPVSTGSRASGSGVSGSGASGSGVGAGAAVADDGPPLSPQAVAVRAELVRRMTTLLEKLPLEQHEGHGGGVGGKVTAVCGARVYGYEPATATSADDVVTVYGFHMCGLAQPGLPWERAMKMVAPLVIRYDTRPPKIRMAESGAGVSYRDRVKQLFPAKYQRSAFEEALGPAGMAELRRRYTAVAGV